MDQLVSARRRDAGLFQVNDPGLRFRGSEALPFGAEIRAARELFDHLLARRALAEAA